MTATTEPTRAPSKALYLTDYARSTWDIGALSVTLPVLARAPRGDGHAVLVIPGLGASDVSTLILRRFLEIYASHFGIGNHPAALWVIADRLTQAPGKWAPFRPPARWRCAYPTPIATDPVDLSWPSSRPTGRPGQVPARPSSSPWRGVRFVPSYLLSIWSWLGNGVPLCQGRTWPKRTSSP